LPYLRQTVHDPIGEINAVLKKPKEGEQHKELPQQPRRKPLKVGPLQHQQHTHPRHFHQGKRAEQPTCIAAEYGYRWSPRSAISGQYIAGHCAWLCRRHASKNYNQDKETQHRPSESSAPP
jgi:hypothetical protein